MLKINLFRSLLLMLLIGSFLAWPDRAAMAQATPSTNANNGPAAPTDSPSPASATPRFPQNVPHPINIGVAVVLNDIVKVNEQVNTYEANYDLRLRWRDPGLAFDAKVVGFDRQQFGIKDAPAKLASIWSPEVSIANMPDKPSSLETGLFIYSDGTVVYIQRLQAVFQTDFNLAAFPFDSQSLSLVLVSPNYTANQIVFLQDQKDIDLSGIKPNAKNAGWELRDMHFDSSTLRCWNGDFCPKFEIKTDVKRDSSSYASMILVPYFLILVVPIIMTLYIKMDVLTCLGAWANAILALVALAFTFSVSFPAAGSGSLISQLITIGFGFQLSMVFLTITIFNPTLAERVNNACFIEELKSYLRWSVPVGLFGLILAQIFLTIFA